MRIFLAAVALAAAAALSACSHHDPTESPQHNLNTELRREQDCANPTWKTAHLGLWYNVCRPNQAE